MWEWNYAGHDQSGGIRRTLSAARFLRDREMAARLLRSSYPQPPRLSFITHTSDQFDHRVVVGWVSWQHIQKVEDKIECPEDMTEGEGCRGNRQR